MSEVSQFALLKKRRFGPLFVTQFLGAFNDNVFRNALVTMITFQLVGLTDGDINTLINLCAGLFILPFFLFSASAGQLADKYEKSTLIRRVKLLEIVIMAAATIGFFTGNVYWLIALLFLMGTQSALFGPLKYGILPQQLRADELIGGNGMIEMGTYLAILLGLIVGGNLIGLEGGHFIVSAIVVVLAVAGYLASRGIPRAAPVDPGLKVNWNLFTETGRSVALTRENLVVFRAILGISWFWLLGSVYLTQLPNYTRLVLGGNEQLFTFLMALFSIGIGTGSILCERLSGRQVEIGLVPFGAIGLTLFGIDLFFAAPSPVNTGVDSVGIGVGAFLSGGSGWRVTLDIVLIGVFGGLFIVPLYALIQQRSAASHRSRVIAGNNIINAFFMVLSALLSITLLSAGVSIPQLFLIVAVLNALVAAYIFTLVPEFLMRFLVWILIHLIYRVDKRGLENIPDSGPVVLVCNHVSFVDAVVIAGCVRRPVKFVMDHRIYRAPVLHFIFRTAGAIPIASAKDDPEMLERAFQRIGEYLRDDDIVAIFPEGRITRDGDIDTFRSGIERIVASDPAPVVPMALSGLWGSYYSRARGNAMSGLPRPSWRRIFVNVGTPIPPQQVDADDLRERVAALRGERR